MFEDVKIVYCKYCEHSVFPAETYPWGTCCLDKHTICKTAKRGCNNFEWRKEKEHGKNE